jgi:hypothetical protein
LVVFAKLFRRGSRGAEWTFKERVDDFWRWFPTVAERFGRDLKAKSSELAEEMSERVNGLGPGFAWELGPDGEKTSLTLSGEGNLHRQLLTQYWWQKAPTVPGWNFYPARSQTSRGDWNW